MVAEDDVGRCGLRHLGLNFGQTFPGPDHSQEEGQVRLDADVDARLSHDAHDALGGGEVAVAAVT